MRPVGNKTNQVGNATIVEGRNNTAITHNYGDNYYQSNGSGNSGLWELEKKVAFNALHDSEARYPQPNVLPGTRKEILRRLCSWCEDPSKNSRVFWVHGAAGVGKSAIAQALSEKYIQSGQLAASFFFSRNDATRDKLEPFIATIAHQFAISSSLGPYIAPLISHTISSKSGILTKNWEIQFQTLIGEPSIQVNPKFWSQLPKLVIIDGVDECVRIESQERLLQMIQATTPTLPLDFLIFSRPEPHICDIFHAESFIPSPFHISLGNFALEVRSDIEKFLRSEFSRVRKKHQRSLLSQPESWPGDPVIQQLLDRATGQFIYATTVIKYIDIGEMPVTPMQRLDVILQALPVDFSSPYPDLDLLYSQILSYCINPQGKLQQMLRLIVSPFDPYQTPEQWNYFHLDGSPESVDYTSLSALEQLLDLSPGEASSLLSGLHSILEIPISQTKNIIVLHASFSEFLLDKCRSGKFYVGTKLTEEEWKQLLIARRIHILSQFCRESQQLPTSSSKHSINGIHNIDIGSLNVWKNITDAWITGPVIDGKIVEALNAFDPHLYLTTLLCWRYKRHSSKQIACIVSRFTSQSTLDVEDDLQYYMTAVHEQINMLYSAFLFLKKVDKSSTCRLQKFFKTCKSFFRGFYVLFTTGQRKNLIQTTLLTCQLSISHLGSSQKDAFLPGFFAASTLLSSAPPLPLINCSGVSFKIVPSDQYNGPYPTAPRGWEVKRINSTEGQLLHKLSECLFEHSREKFYSSERIFTVYEMEDWADKLAHLDWKRTWRTYVEGKLTQKVQFKR